MTKEYTAEELQGLLAESAESDHGWLAEAIGKLNKILERGDSIAVYANEDPGSPSVGHRQYVSYGAKFAQIETARPPEQMPDIGNAINWRYRLAGTYNGAKLDIVAALRLVKPPILPAVAYVKTMSEEEDGSPRQGWAIYREQKLIEFVHDIGGEFEHRLAELGVSKEWATGTIDVSEEFWAEVTNEENWPPSDPHKFPSHRAERLYGCALEGFSDDQIGDSDWGAYYLFREDENAILCIDTRGAVTLDVYDTETELDSAWTELSNAWDAYNDEGEEDQDDAPQEWYEGMHDPEDQRAFMIGAFQQIQAADAEYAGDDEEDAE